MTHEENHSAVQAAESENTLTKNQKIGFIRTFFGITIGLISLFFTILFLLFLLSYCYGYVSKEKALPLLLFTGFFPAITLVPGYFLLKPFIKFLKDKTKPDIHESGKYYAGFWRRLGAGFVDVMIFSPIYFGGFFLGKINLVVYEIVDWSGIIATVYTLIMVTYYGQTVGKMVFRVKVFKVNGDEVSFIESLKRNYGDICIWLILLVSHIYVLTEVNLSQLNGLTYNQIDEVFAKGNFWTNFGIFLMILWYFSEFITLLFNRKKRAIHDFIAGTILLVENKNVPMR